MAILKFYDNDKKWNSLYARAINNRLRRDKNLADLFDKAEARKNLELTGDNNHTHYHDDRYMPLIEGINQNISELKNEINQLNLEIGRMNNVVSVAISNMEKKFFVGSTAPSSPLDKTVWFDTGNNITQIYNGGKWKKFGAVYL